MKKIAVLLLLALAIGFCQEFPQHTDKYVNDFAGIFTGAQVTELRSILSDVEANTTAEVVIVTVNTTAPYAPSQYRTMLFNEWGVGKADIDNGLLILYAVAEHRIEVEVGYGLEGILPDSKVGRMLDDYYVPLRDANRTTEGIIEYTKATALLLKENSAEIRSGSGHSALGTFEVLAWLFFPFIFFIVIIAIFILVARKKKGKKGKKGKDKWLWLGGGLGGGRFGGGGGGFGGGGFGGGGSGGGGAGR